jgi:tRNA(fMet)-specific endonuclease VapC
MRRYMLDTDTCSYIMKRSNDAVLERLQKIPVHDVYISIITKSELLCGVEMSPRRTQDEVALSAFLQYVGILDFPDQACLHCAKIRADLKALGTIGANDLFIAAHAQPRPDTGHKQYARVQSSP